MVCGEVYVNLFNNFVEKPESISLIVVALPASLDSFGANIDLASQPQIG